MKILEGKKFIGYGVDITDFIKITVCGVAARMVFNLPLGAYYFSHIEKIKIYSGKKIRDGVVGEMEHISFYGGVSLAWGHVLMQLYNPFCSSNTIIHEFAHAIDSIDRMINGIPRLLLKKDQIDEWKKVFNVEDILKGPEGIKVCSYFKLSRWNDHAKKYRSHIIECEMFAVASEKYFEEPRKLYKVSPSIYRQLNIVYKQNTLENHPGFGILGRVAGLIDKIKIKK